MNAAADHHEHDKTLATSDGMAELRAEIAELRREMKAGFQRLHTTFLRLSIGGFIMLTGGFGAIIAKLYFGV